MLSYKNWKTLNENMMPSFNLGVSQPQSMGMIGGNSMGQDAGSGSEMSGQAVEPDSDMGKSSSEDKPESDNMVSQILDILKDDNMSNKEKAEKIAAMKSGEASDSSSEGEEQKSDMNMSGSAEAPKTEAYHMFGDEDEDMEDEGDEEEDEDMEDEMKEAVEDEQDPIDVKYGLKIPDYGHKKISALQMHTCDDCQEKEYALDMKYIKDEHNNIVGVFCPKCLGKNIMKIRKDASIKVGPASKLRSQDFKHELPHAYQSPAKEYGPMARKKLGLDPKYIGTDRDKPVFSSGNISLAKRLKDRDEDMSNEETAWWNSVNSMLGYENEKNSDGISELPAPTEPKAGEVGFAPQGRIGWFQ